MFEEVNLTGIILYIYRERELAQWVWEGNYHEIQNTSCVSFVGASEFWQTSYNKTYATNVSQFAINDEENPLCELFITSTYILVWIHLWAWNNNKTASLHWQPFHAVPLNARDKELQSHIQCSHRQMYLRVFNFLSTQTNKKQRTDLANSVYRKWRRKNYMSLFCAVYL